jgi:hypothetical protein
MGRTAVVRSVPQAAFWKDNILVQLRTPGRLEHEVVRLNCLVHAKHEYLLWTVPLLFGAFAVARLEAFQLKNSLQ